MKSIVLLGFFSDWTKRCFVRLEKIQTTGNGETGGAGAGENRFGQEINVDLQVPRESLALKVHSFQQIVNSIKSWGL